MEILLKPRAFVNIPQAYCSRCVHLSLANRYVIIIKMSIKFWYLISIKHFQQLQSKYMYMYHSNNVSESNSLFQLLQIKQQQISSCTLRSDLPQLLQVMQLPSSGGSKIIFGCLTYNNREILHALRKVMASPLPAIQKLWQCRLLSWPVNSNMKA
jgi:phosphotransferase system HPr-like phosphotransfer protein